MVKDDVVLLAPAERAKVIEVIVVKKMPGNGFCDHICRAINELGRQEKTERGEFGKLIKHGLADL